MVRTFCSVAAKTSTVTPIFYFMLLIRTVLPFNVKNTVLAKVYVQFFGNFTKWYGLNYNELKSACPNLVYFGA